MEDREKCPLPSPFRSLSFSPFSHFLLSLCARRASSRRPTYPPSLSLLLVFSHTGKNDGAIFWEGATRPVQPSKVRWVLNFSFCFFLSPQKGRKWKGGAVVTDRRLLRHCCFQNEVRGGRSDNFLSRFPLERTSWLKPTPANVSRRNCRFGTTWGRRPIWIFGKTCHKKKWN